MILQRLHELSLRKKLLEDPAFIQRDVACRIDIGPDGQYLGLHDLREAIVLTPKSKKGTPKTVLNNGRSMLVPVRPVVWDDKIGRWKATDPAANGKEKPSVFMADTLARVLPLTRLIPVEQREKFDAQRSTFWRFLSHATAMLSPDEANPYIAFRKLLDDDAFQERLCSDVEKLGLTIANLAVLALHSDRGQTLLDKSTYCDFWRSFFSADSVSQQEGQFSGICQVTGKVGPIGESVKSRLKGLVSIGCRADAYLVTALGSADSYNLSGAQAAMVSEEGVNSFTRAANALIGNNFENQKTSYRIGELLLLYWTRKDSPTDLNNLFDPTVDDVSTLLQSASRGKAPVDTASDDAFYLLMLSGNSARVVVRDYIETPLMKVRESLASWFRDLRIAEIGNESFGKPTSLFPLWILATATAFDSDAVAPDTSSRLVFAAIQDRPIPESILLACLRRLRAEGAKGFRAARMGLIKLILIRRGVAMTEVLNADEKHPAYLYGRLLSVFEQIQYAALGDINANVVDKFYGVFSAAPAMVFNRLFNNAQNHLRKLRGEKPGTFTSLDKRLTELVAELPSAPPSSHLSMLDQGRFALGYYHQRARQFEAIAERKAEKASKTTE